MDQGICCVKALVNTIGWKPELLAWLLELVKDVNLVTTHTYHFIRYMFVAEKAGNPDWDLEEWIVQCFFQEAWESLTTRTRRTTEVVDINRYRDLIDYHLLAHKHLTGFVQVEMTNTHQIAVYESRPMYAAYIRNIRETFGHHWQQLGGKLVNSDHFEGDKALLQEFKQSMWCQNPPHWDDPRFLDVQATFARIHDAYPAEYDRFENDSILYDVKCSPEKHLNAFYAMACINVERTLADNATNTRGFKIFQPFPMRTSFIPAYMQIDTVILKHHILKDHRQ